MSRIARLMLATLAAAAALVAASPLLAATKKPQHHPQVGIGDNKDDMFSDPRFLALGIKTVRYSMAWDVLAGGYQTRDVTTWMKAAKAHHLDVLITIDHSRRYIVKVVKVREKVHGKWTYVKKKKRVSQSRVLPSATQYVAAFKAFRKRFPWVKNYVTWDETNYFGEATYDKEGLVASYYRGMRKACSSCTILAAEFLDVDKHEAVPLATWAKKFVKDLGYQPGYWAINDYEDANHLVSTSTRQLLGAVTGKVWLAETGGIVNRHNGTTHPGFPQNATHAAKADSYVLNTLGSLSPRIQRIYLYEWDAQTKLDSWDTALISYNNVPRPGYNVLANTLFSWGVKPNCALSTVPPSCKKTGATGPTGPTSATGATGATH